MILHELAGHQAAPDHFCAVPHFVCCKLLHKAARHSHVINLRRAPMEVFPWLAGAVVVFLQACAAAIAYFLVCLRTLKLCCHQ